LRIDIEMLKELTEASGVSGFEHEIREVLARYLNPYATLSTDGLGSLVARREGASGSPNIMLTRNNLARQLMKNMWIYICVRLSQKY
jgi:putative aminopeptidase FrvX